jgi:DNA polymerase III delta prime subunit
MDVIITGLPASGKTTLARDLAANLTESQILIETDSHRYTDNNWTKAPRAVYRARIAAAIAEAKADTAHNGHFIIESSYRDSHDPEQARIHALHDIIETAPSDRKPILVRIRSLDGKDALKKLMHRILGRADGTVPQGTCPETLDSISETVQKFVRSYDDDCSALDAFETWAAAQGCTVFSLTYDEARAKFHLDTSIRRVSEMDWMETPL